MNRQLAGSGTIRKASPIVMGMRQPFKVRATNPTVVPTTSQLCSATGGGITLPRVSECISVIRRRWNKRVPSTLADCYGSNPTTTALQSTARASCHTREFRVYGIPDVRRHIRLGSIGCKVRRQRSPSFGRYFLERSRQIGTNLMVDFHSNGEH